MTLGDDQPRGPATRRQPPAAPGSPPRQGGHRSPEQPLAGQPTQAGAPGESGRAGQHAQGGASTEQGWSGQHAEGLTTEPGRAGQHADGLAAEPNWAGQHADGLAAERNWAGQRADGLAGEPGRAGQHADGLGAEPGRAEWAAEGGRHSSDQGSHATAVPAPRVPGDDATDASHQAAGAETTEAGPRAGTHAAPYMDADGTLHNLRPIGRLTVSGPDTEPRRPGDTEFGSLWFSAAEEAKAAAEQAAAELPTRKRVKRVDGPAPAPAGEDGAPDHVVIDLDLSGLLGGLAVAEEQPAEPEQDGRTGDLDGPTHQTASELDEGSAVAEPPAGASEGPAGPARDETSAESTGSDAAGRTGSWPQVQPLPVAAGVEPLMELAADEIARRPEDSAVDLQAIRWRLDGGTLREVVDDKEALRELGERLDTPLADDAGRVAKAALLSVRAEVYRLLGELGMAAAASRLALAHAESAQDVQSMVIAQAELAHVLRLRGDFVEADRLFSRAANAQVPDALRSVVHENAGRCCFDQGRHMEALDHFARAVRLGRPDDNDLAERIGVCLEAVYIHVLRDGWGPYPRRSLDILGVTGRTQPSGAARPERAEPDAFDKRSTFSEITAERPAVQRR